MIPGDGLYKYGSSPINIFAGVNMPKHTLKMHKLTHEQLMSATPEAVPVKVVEMPDFEWLIKRIEANGGWTLILTDATKDRMTALGSESPLVKAFNNHMRITHKRPLYTRRLASNLWYLEVGE